MALGIVALYLGLAVGISTWLRPRIGYTWWRRLHVLTFGVYVLATLHGLGTGSDAQTWWGLGIYLVSIVLVGLLLYQRLLARANKRKHAPAHPGVPRRVLPLPSTSPPR
jgi:predicted ferric reductase